MHFLWLKKYMPRSLYGRAALILVVPVVFVQLVVSVVFIQRHFDGVTRQLSLGAAIELQVLIDEIALAADPGARAAEMARSFDFVITLPAPVVPAADSRRFYDLSGRIVAEVLRERLGSVLAIAMPDDGWLGIWLDTAAGPIEVTMRRVRVSASNPHQLLVIMLIFGALMTGIAFIYLRNQLRPITRLAHAASEYGRGRMVPYHVSGATEVRAAGTAFLDMRARLERQSQTRTLMLSGISHDLRTPLTRLRLGLSLIDEEEATPLLGDVAEMERLVTSFLDYVRDNAAEERTEVIPAELAATVVADCARGGGQVLLGPLTGGNVPVSMGALAMRRALENLISNALRHGTRARLSLVMGDKSLRFTVEDDGPGIPPEARDEAIRPFVRLDPARNQDRGGGVGLGLAIVADIARAHGGSLRLGDSEDLGGLRADLVIAL